MGQFHVVILQRTTRKCTSVRAARLFSFLFNQQHCIALHCSCRIYLSSLRHSFQQKSRECIRIERALYKCISLIVSFRKCTTKALALIKDTYRNRVIFSKPVENLGFCFRSYTLLFLNIAGGHRSCQKHLKWRESFD